MMAAMPTRPIAVRPRPLPVAPSPPAPRAGARRLRAGSTVLAAALAVLLAAPAPAAAGPAPPPAPELTGLALGPDRLPSCAAVVAEMAPRTRLAQRLMIGVDASDPRGTAETVRATQVGGVFVGGNAPDLLSDQALRAVQAMSRIPLAVAVDDEGGRVQRVDDLDGELPSARAMAGLTPLRVRELGRDRARALIARGVTMNLAPTVDVGNQPAGDVIGDRAFGNDPELVTSYAGAFAQGQREAGLFTVLKHFPGHGHGDGDSHQGRVRTPPLEDLRRSDLRPYAALVGPGGPLADGRTGVMVGHLDVPGLTGELPSSLTPAVYALLREEYRFDGLVLTDDLGAMKAVTGIFELSEAVERALAAGADMALWSSGVRVTPVLDALEQALRAGRLDSAANDRAVQRILAAKATCS
jgi:beta-N-acetylhexosaminidase